MRQRASLPAVVALSGMLLTTGLSLAASTAPTASVGWPTSSGLLVGEIVTGGASGSDEYAELYNASASPIDLGGLELAYVTSSGSTVTRKAAWTAGTTLGAGGHLLVANSSGIYAVMADAVYSGGFAATGGALVLRPIGGTPIDAVGWGDATNGFVEGTAAVAPPAGQSIERRPGGLAGNGTDTNANASDFFINPSPAPQNRSAPPVPAPVPSASPTPTVDPTQTPVPTQAPSPTDASTPTASATLEPTPTPEVTPTPEPTSVPTATPGGTATVVPTETAIATEAPTAQPSDGPSPLPSPTPEPSATLEATPTASPSATASPSPSLLTVAQARAVANGTDVDIVGTLTTPPGLLESGTGAFIQDVTGGIALYLATADWPVAVEGALVSVRGTVDDRYAQRTIRLASGTAVVVLGSGLMPFPVLSATGTATEGLEGTLVTIAGQVTAGPDPLSDGFAVTVDDGSGALRVVATVASGVAAADLPPREWFELTGALGQRDSTGTGTSGYRLYLRSPDDVVSLAAPTPPPSPTPPPTPIPTATPIPTGTPPPSPTPAPTASPSPFPSQTASPAATPTAAPSSAPTPTVPGATPIAFARTRPMGSTALVEGVVTAETGRIIDERSVVIQDATGGIVVALPAAGTPALARGTRIRVAGVLAAPYGNLEIRPASAAAVTVLGTGVQPAPLAVKARELGEPIEGRLVRATGQVMAVDEATTSGGISVDVQDESGTLRVYVYGTTGITRDAFPKGSLVEVTGIEGQRAPSTGSPAGHRIWPRDLSDVRPVTSVRPSASPAGTGAGGSGSPGTPITITAALAGGGDVTVSGIVTTPAGFVDGDGRRVVIEDPTGAVLVRLPASAAAPGVGTRLIATGSMGTFYGWPQLELADRPAASGIGVLAPRVLGGPPNDDLDWRLVRVTGAVTSVHRLGTTWRAEVTVAGEAVPIYGTARSGIPSTALVEGRVATVVGVVRPPYPTATDRRPAVAPRFAADIAIRGGASTGASHGGSLSSGSGVQRAASGSPGAGTALDVEIAELPEHEGQRVRVGGLVGDTSAGRIVIDDGTGQAAIRPPDDAATLAADVRPGEALNVTGVVVRDGADWAVAPASVADIARVGSLGELAPLAVAAPANDDPPTGVSPVTAQSGWPPGAAPLALALAGTGVTVLMRRRSVRDLLGRMGAVLRRRMRPGEA